MAYWGNKADECDYAFDCMGSYIVYMREAMLSAATGAISDKYPEQSVVVTLKAIRALWEVFPKSVACTFHKGDFEESKRLFNEWLAVVGPKLSMRRQKALVAEADSVFAKCAEMYREPPAEDTSESSIAG